MYYIKMKCQRMVGQCPTYPIGCAVADIKGLIKISFFIFNPRMGRFRYPKVVTGLAAVA